MDEGDASPGAKGHAGSICPAEETATEVSGCS